MRKNVKTGRLAFNRTTLRALSDEQLAAIGGGALDCFPNSSFPRLCVPRTIVR